MATVSTDTAARMLAQQLAIPEDALEPLLAYFDPTMSGTVSMADICMGFIQVGM